MKYCKICLKSEEDSPIRNNIGYICISCGNKKIRDSYKSN